MQRTKVILLLCAIMAAFCINGYPVRCQSVGDSLLGAVTDCDVSHDPLPFTWTSTVTLKKGLKWAGIDDVKILYSNPNETVSSNCTLTVPLPGTYNKNANLTIEQTCTSFTPALFKGATLAIIFFYTHHDSFDDVLMYNFPIPGYINEGAEYREIEGEEKAKLWAKVTQLKKEEQKAKSLQTQ